MATTMRALAVHEWGQTPTLSQIPKPDVPADGSKVQVKVVASGLAQLVRSQASGNHYSSASAKLPYIPGADGVGVEESTGEFLYFTSVATGGGFGEYINVPKGATVPIPFPKNSEGKELSYEEKLKIAIRIAALANPTMASWMAMKTRTSNLRDGFTVVINGVTSLSGQIAISLARSLGAAKVIGMGRNEGALKKLAIDQYIVVQEPDKETDFAAQLKDQHIDVILDFVYGGGSTLHLLQSLTSNAMKAHELETQFVQIGSLGGPDIDLPSALLRSRNLTIRGSGPGSWSVTKDYQTYFPGLLERLVAGVGEFTVVERQLEDVEETWADKKTRSVFVM